MPDIVILLIGLGQIDRMNQIFNLICIGMTIGLSKYWHWYEIIKLSLVDSKVYIILSFPECLEALKSEERKLS